MGMATESAILNQLKKAQAETNERVDKLIAWQYALVEAQRQTNELLRALLAPAAV